MYPKEHKKMMSDLTRLLKAQKFETVEEMEKFLNEHLPDGKVPSFPEMKLSKKEQAEDLIFDAYDLIKSGEEKDMAKAFDNVEKALELNKNCIEAYEFLANVAPTFDEASGFLLQGIDIGLKKFCGKSLKENKGYFWGMMETRPFMRCMKSYADGLFAEELYKKAADFYEQLLDLNPDDNQGVRYMYLLALIASDRHEEFQKFEKKCKDEDSAFILFSRALFAFKTMGKCTKSNNLLKKAIDSNKFAVKKLLAKTPPKNSPGYYSWGSEEEAIMYVQMAKPVWKSVDGALEWLKNLEN